MVLRECVLNDEPEPIADLPEHVNAALLKALSKKKENRFPDCKSFVKALAAKTKRDEGIHPGVAPTLPADPESKKTIRLTSGWIIGLIVALLLGILGYFFCN